MPTIGIIDDRADHRETVRRTIELRLRRFQGWAAVDSEPLAAVTDYPSWIAENDVAVLVLDERLTESRRVRDVTVNYNGHHVVQFLRTTYRDLPIYVVTAYPDDTDLRRHLAAVDDIID